MDKLTQYQQAITEVLTEMANERKAARSFETELVLDRERNHYLLINLGWQDLHRTYGNTGHIDIKDDKVWLQQDMTDARVADRLLEKGIPKEDIVLAFHAPYKRPYTGFAVA